MCGKEIPDDNIFEKNGETYEDHMKRLGEGHLCVSVEKVVKRGDSLGLCYYAFCEECEDKLIEAVRKAIGDG